MMNTERQKDYLNLLAGQHPTIESASTALINLQAQLNLPKGTEHFISDIHGEFDSFRHVLKNGSGSIKRTIQDIFSDRLPKKDKRDLALLIYYPEKKISHDLAQTDDAGDWYHIALSRLITVSRVYASSYSRSRVRELLPPNYLAIVEELLYEQENAGEKADYYQSIIDAVVATDSARALITILAELIQTLAIARLHIIGDIYDRGPGAHLIMDVLCDYHCVDIQWGNHDIVWMGAAAGSEACIANVVRMSLRYANLETLENGYAISLLPLASFAIETYADDPCERFVPRLAKGQEFSVQEQRMMAQMQKAITVIQFKVEGQIIARRPQYHMEDRLLLDKIDLERGTVAIDGTDYPLLDRLFPTLDPADPYALTPGEQAVVDRLVLSFTNSAKLQKHVRFLFANGGMCKAHNGNLLYHGCIAMNEDGSFKAFRVSGEEFSGKAFVDRVDMLARQGYFSTDDPDRKTYGMDAMWYLWSGAESPLFGKKKMATFERYLVADKSTHKEHRNPYYDLRNDETASRRILQEFGLDPDTGRIINGHVPVQVLKGESPVKANGKLVVIDGGFAKAYQSKTGIAGYTLVFNAYGVLLVAHQPFESAQKAIDHGEETDNVTEVLNVKNRRLKVRDTDEGQAIQRQIDDLQQLLSAYRQGLIQERK